MRAARFALSLRRRQMLADAIRKYLNINTAYIGFVLAKEVPKTSSGKIMRYKVKQEWVEKTLHLISFHNFESIAGAASIDTQDNTPFSEIKRKYNLGFGF